MKMRNGIMRFKKTRKMKGKIVKNREFNFK